MICETHNRFFPTKRCPICEKEQKELERAIYIAEYENAKPIVIWENEKTK